MVISTKRLCLLSAVTLLCVSLSLTSSPARAFGEGLSGAVNTAAVAAVTGYGVQAATSASDDDDDD